MCYCSSLSCKYVSKNGKENFGSSSCLGDPDLWMEVDDSISETAKCMVCFMHIDCTKLPSCSYTVFIFYRPYDAGGMYDAN